MVISCYKLPALLALFKPSGDPLLDVAGAYFPAWLACLFAGGLATWALAAVAEKSGLSAALRPGILMLPCLFCAITCGVWLLFFSVR